MLVLGRRLYERVVIDVAGVRVVVTLVRAELGRARLGFEAPPEAVIHRAELLARYEGQEGGGQ